MSSNNQVVIIERKDGFYIYENSCVDNDFVPCARNLISKAKSLRKAIKEADAFCKVYPYVEYGYIIKLLDKKDKKEVTK